MSNFVNKTCVYAKVNNSPLGFHLFYYLSPLTSKTFSNACES